MADPDRSFAGLFGRPADIRAEAPGRVNLIGEHTDYHEGFVLPCAIPQRTRVELARRRDTRVRLWTAAADEAPGEYEIGAEARRNGWIDYVQGVTWALSQQRFAISGFDLRVDSDVPVGEGLSSSAALEVSTLRALRSAFDLDLDDVELARLAQRAEVEFVGAPVGILDQMASSLAREREALFLDTRTLSFSRLPFPAAMDLVVIGSGISHKHAGGEYATRRAESEDAARQLGVRVLRDIPEPVLNVDRLPPLLARRARHVVTENARVQRAVDALKAADLPALGALLRASHASLRDDYEVSIPEVDALVDAADADPDVYGARMTGGGFGGAIVVVAKGGTAAAVARRTCERYRHHTARDAQILVPPTCG